MIKFMIEFMCWDGSTKTSLYGATCVWCHSSSLSRMNYIGECAHPDEGFIATMCIFFFLLGLICNFAWIFPWIMCRVIGLKCSRCKKNAHKNCDNEFNQDGKKYHIQTQIPYLRHMRKSLAHVMRRMKSKHTLCSLFLAQINTNKSSKKIASLCLELRIKSSTL